MSNFEDAVIQRIKQLEREVERLQKWERPVIITDHGALTGLGDDDHTQYLNTTRHDTTTRHTLGTVVPHDDHGQLTGLTDDDHTQYTKHPASSTDNAIVRWDGTGGRTIQNSGVRIDDNGKLSGNGLDGWIYDTDTWSYVSTTSFKVSGKDVRYKFPKGTKIKLVQSGITKYFYVTATAYSADTTITITGGSDYSLANATISGQAYSYAATPQDFPLGTSTFVPLTTPKTSTDWDGDAYSTTSATKIDTSAVFGIPDGVKALIVRVLARDSASFPNTSTYFQIGPASSANNQIRIYPVGGDIMATVTGICNCDANGDIYYSLASSGTGTMDCWIEIWGYWL